MDRIIFVYHLLFLCLQSYEGSLVYNMKSACFGSGIQECYWVQLACDTDRTIEIVEAEYRYDPYSKPGCENKISKGICNDDLVMECCSPKEGDQVANFSETHLQTLTASCSGRLTCATNAVRGPIGDIFSSFVVVRYICTFVHESSTETTQPQTGDSNTSTDGNSAAVVVVPIVIVLLCLSAGIVAYLYWRRRQTMKSSDKEKENRTPNDVNPGIQNKKYYMEELENVNGDVSDPEDTYHTIDADSIPDSTTNYNEYSELEPTITYETLDLEKVEKDDSRQYDNKVQRTSCLDNESKDGDNNNKVEHDNGIATNEYFILESEEDPNNQQKDPNLVATDNTVIHINDVAPTSYEYFILESESDPCNQAKDHDNIISNNNDMAPTSNDYFILEPEGVPSDQQNGHILNADIDSTEYNTINPQTNAIVKDPRYQRLGAIQH